MQIKIYNKIKELFASKIPEVKHIRLYNNQFKNYSKEKSWLFPCCFIEFNHKEYIQLQRNVQEIKTDIIFHLKRNA